MPERIVIEINSLDTVAPAIQDLLRRGSTFVRGALGLSVGDEIEIALTRTADRETLTLCAVVVVIVVQGDPGVGLDIRGFTDRVRTEIECFISHTEDEPAKPAPVEDDPGNCPQNLHQRLRGLSVAQQLKVARDGDVHERTVLERLYGKTVWEALLRNPRLTSPEVARIARMGALPRPQLEQILANPAWTSSSQVRRALFANHRMTGDMIDRLLRVAPRSELRTMPKQTAYPPAVREAARKLIRKLGVG